MVVQLLELLMVDGLRIIIITESRLRIVVKCSEVKRTAPFLSLLFPKLPGLAVYLY